MKKPDIDDADIAKFLSDIFTDIRRTTPVSEGMESKALAFRDGHDDYVLRINRGNEGFLKDAYAHTHFASEHLPIPEVIRIGEFDKGFAYCISRRAPGRTLQDFPEEELSRLVQPVAATMRQIANADISNMRGYGPFGSDGVGRYESWRAFLVGIADPSHRDWSKFDGAIDRQRLSTYLRLLLRWAEHCPETRSLVHADFGSNNVLAAKGEITAVIDWSEAMIGDPLYDVANIFFWRSWLPCMEHQANYLQQQSRALASSTALRCYQLHIGLHHLHECLVAGLTDDVAWTIARCEQLVQEAD